MRVEESRETVGTFDLYIEREYSADANVTLEGLIELRCEIEKFILMRLASTLGREQ